MAPMPLPALRGSLKIFPYKHEDKDVFVVLDHQEQLFEHQIVLPPMAFVVASLLDGRRDAAAVQKEIKEQLKVEVTTDEVESVVRDLEHHLLLESGRTREKRQQVADDFSKLPARPSKFVEGTADEVTGRLDGYFAGEAGAGKIGARRDEPLSGILAPHIDFNRGGPCYSFAYRELAERCDADLYVILGVAHLSPPNPFVVTGKDYETPLGTVATDRDAIAVLEKRLGKKIYDHEPVHRSEHSAEFQAVFLKHARPKAKFTVVPILCSAFEQWCGARSPSTAAEVEDVLGAIRESVASPEFAAKMTPLGATARVSTPADFRARVERDIAHFKRVVAARSIAPE